jgi:hypothetical protein
MKRWVFAGNNRVSVRAYTEIGEACHCGKTWRGRQSSLRTQPLAAIAVTSTRMPSTAREATPTAARTGQGLAKKRW